MSNKKKTRGKSKGHGDREKIIKGAPYNKGKLDSILAKNRERTQKRNE